MGMQKIKGIVTNCRLGHAFEQWCIAYAAQARFKSVPDDLGRLIKDTFSGWNQTRVNEKANKVWRDVGNRANASGIVAMVALWEKLTHAEVLGEFERQEISNLEGAVAESERDFDMQELFLDPTARVTCKLGDGPAEIEKIAKENEWLAKFDKIAGESGKAFTPESEQILTAQLRLLRTLKENNLWHQANDAWNTALLPVGGLIRVVSSNTHLWVLKTNDCAALCWPAEQVSMNMWRKDPKAKELIWYTCFDLKDVQVLTVRVESPKSLFLQESPSR